MQKYSNNPLESRDWQKNLSNWCKNWILEPGSITFAKALVALASFLFFSFSLASLCAYSLRVDFVDPRYPGIYILLFLFVAAGLKISTQSIKENYKTLLVQQDRRVALEILFVVLITSLYIAERYYSYPLVGIWLDEYSQFTGAFLKQSFIAGALKDVQPPLGSLNTYGSIVFFGKTFFAIKFLSLFSGLLASWTFFAFARICRASLFVSFLLTIGFVSFSPFVQQSLEARNLSQMTLCLFIMLVTLQDYYEGPESKKIVRPILAVTLFLYSAGFQTFIFAGPAIIFFCLLSDTEKTKWLFKKTLVIIGASYLLLLPSLLIQFQAVAQRGTLNKDFLKNSIEIFRNLQLSQYSYFWSSFPPNFWFMAFVTVTLALSFFSKGSLRKKAVGFVTLSVFFAVAFDTIFKAKIVGIISERHYLIFNLLVYAWLPYFFGALLLEYHSHPRNRLRVLNYTLSFFTIFLALELAQTRNHHLARYDFSSNLWKRIYEKLSENYNENDFNFYLLRSEPFYKWSHTDFIAPEFFVNPTRFKRFRDCDHTQEPGDDVQTCQLLGMPSLDLTSFSPTTEPIFIFPRTGRVGSDPRSEALARLPANSGISVVIQDSFFCLSLEKSIASGLTYSEKIQTFYERLIKSVPSEGWSLPFQKDLIAIYKTKHLQKEYAELLNNFLRDLRETTPKNNIRSSFSLEEYLSLLQEI